MSLDDQYPPQYFGPHARRWTHPVTGEVLSLQPSDHERASHRLAQLLASDDDFVLYNEDGKTIRIGPYRDCIKQIQQDGRNDYKLVRADPLRKRIISLDSLYERGDITEATLFKDMGVTFPGGWSVPADQHYDLNAFAPDPDDEIVLTEEEQKEEDLLQKAGRATRGGITWPTTTSTQTFEITDPETTRLLTGGTLRGASIDEEKLGHSIRLTDGEAEIRFEVYGSDGERCVREYEKYVLQLQQPKVRWYKRLLIAARIRGWI